MPGPARYFQPLPIQLLYAPIEIRQLHMAERRTLTDFTTARASFGELAQVSNYLPMQHASFADTLTLGLIGPWGGLVWCLLPVCLRSCMDRTI